MREPVRGTSSRLSMLLAVAMKRVAATAIIAVPRTISANPAMLPYLWLDNERERPANDGAVISKNKSNFSTRKPKAITAIAVRTHARNVRSFAAWSLKFLIMPRAISRAMVWSIAAVSLMSKLADAAQASHHTDDEYQQARQKPHVERHAASPHIQQEHRSDLVAVVGYLVRKRIVP
jgi:hypothetical protein